MAHYALSKDGLYDPTRTSTNGNVASVYGPVDLGQHTIRGSLLLGPEVTQNYVGTNQVSGQIVTDFNLSFPDATLPNTAWQNPPAPVKVGKNQTYNFTASGDYLVSNPYDVVVEPGVKVRLQVTSTDYIPSSIHVKATNGVSGSLEIYQVAGNGTLNDVTLDIARARYFSYYGLPGVTSIKYKGNESFTGTIYAPQAVLTLAGGGNNVGFVGACVAKSTTMDGNHFVFHFDEDLLSAGPTFGYVAQSWEEL